MYIVTVFIAIINTLSFFDTIMKKLIQVRRFFTSSYFFEIIQLQWMYLWVTYNGLETGR